MVQEMSSSDKNSNGRDLSQIRNSAEIRANIQNISAILNTGLSPETLDICIQLCEAGVHPQALANVIQQIRREVIFRFQSIWIHVCEHFLSFRSLKSSMIKAQSEKQTNCQIPENNPFE